MSELEYYKQEANRLAEKIEEEEAKRDLKMVAEKMHEVYQAFIDAGFSEEQAWWMAGSLFAKAIGVNIN